MKKHFISFLLIACLSIPSFSFIKGANLSVGHVSDASDGTPFVVLNNDLESGDFIFGTALNAKGDKDLEGYESFVLTYVEFDDGRRGLYYGQLENIEYGYGLLIDRFNTVYPHPIYSSSHKNSTSIYYDLGTCTLDVLKTQRNLYGVQLRDIRLMNFDIGLVYASEDDGLHGYSEDHKPYTYAYGMYLSYPFLFNGTYLYSEAIKTSNDSSGSSVGLSFGRDFLFIFTKLRIESRSFEPGFIPGYFTSGYYINPINLSSLEASEERRSGTYASLSAGVLGLIGFSMTYENYMDSYNVLGVDFIMTPLSGFDIIGYFKQPKFKQYRDISDDEAVMVGGCMEYRFGKMKISADYKKSPIPGALEAYETTYVRVGYDF